MKKRTKQMDRECEIRVKQSERQKTRKPQNVFAEKPVIHWELFLCFTMKLMV